MARLVVHAWCAFILGLALFVCCMQVLRCGDELLIIGYAVFLVDDNSLLLYVLVYHT